MDRNLKAAIYHFTNGSLKRPIIHLKELERIKSLAESKGYKDISIYVDKTLNKKEQLEFEMMMENISKYDVLFMKDFYHLRKNTGVCISDLLELSKSKVQVYTLEDGSFEFELAPFDNELRVAIYYCGLEIVGRSIDLQYDIMDYFISSKTNWSVVDKYADMNGNKVDDKQLNLMKLIESREKYDLILVQSFNDIHWRTSKFCKYRHQLKLNIYSMYEDIYLKYG